MEFQREEERLAREEALRRQIQEERRNEEEARLRREQRQRELEAVAYQREQTQLRSEIEARQRANPQLPQGQVITTTLHPVGQHQVERVSRDWMKVNIADGTSLDVYVGDLPNQRQLNDFHLFCEKLAQERYPRIYQEAVNLRIGVLKIAYKNERWTYNLDTGRPVYPIVDDYQTFRDSGGLLTPYWRAVIKEGRVKHIRNLNPRRLLLYENRSYDPVHGKRGEPSFVVEAYRARSTKVLTTIERDGLTGVPIVTNLPHTSQSLAIGVALDQEPELGERFPQLTQLSRRTFVNGYIIKTYFQTPVEVMDIRTLCLGIADTLIKQSAEYFRPGGPRPYMTLILNYHDPEDPSRHIDYHAFSGNGFSHQRLADLATHLETLDLRQAILQNTGSDIEEIQEFELDLSGFVIQTINLARSGGGRSKETIEIKGPEGKIIQIPVSYSGRDRKLHYPWGIVEDFDVDRNGCFFKCLNEALKKEGLSSYKSYKQIIDAFAPHLKGREVGWQEAGKIAASVGLKLHILNDNGSTFYVHECPHHQEVKMLLSGTHYCLITRYHPQLEPTVEKIKAKTQDRLILVHYDLETVNRNEAGCMKEPVPYDISWTIDTRLCGGELLPTRSKISAIPSLKLFDHMFEDITSHGSAHYILNAYNGSKFDHYLLYIYLLEKGYTCARTPNLAGKLTAMEFVGYLPNQESFTISVWDVCLFTQCSLDKVAKDCKLPLQKIDLKQFGLGHDVIQREYDEGRFDQLIERSGELIDKYCKVDTFVLRMVTDLVLTSLAEITGWDIEKIVRCPTPPSLSEKLWKELLKEAEMKVLPPQFDKHADGPINTFKKEYSPNLSIDVNVPVGVQISKNGWVDRYPKSDTIIREKTVFAGRTQGKPGRHYFPNGAVLVDVVSEYPYVMKERDFPIGKQMHWYKAEDALAQGLLGFMFVEYDQTTLRFNDAIIPKREKDKPLQWVKHKGRGWLPDVTIKQLIEAGAQVSFPDSGEGFNAIVWEGRAKIFAPFIEKLERGKTEQDEFKEKKDPRYNPMLRSMYKLLLNSLSGKVIQKHHPVKGKLVIGFNAVEKVLFEKETLEAMDNGTFKLHVLSGDSAGLEDSKVHQISQDKVMIETRQDRYNVYSSPPCQLGSYIYAYARAYLYAAVFSRCDVFYSDTDSAVIPLEQFNNIPEECRYQRWDGEKFVKFRDKKFGDLEAEVIETEVPVPGQEEPSIVKNTVFDGMICIAPKTYAIFKDGKCIKWRAKGVQKKDTFWEEDEYSLKRAEGQTASLREVGKYPERFFGLLARRFTNPESRVKVSTVQVARSVREANIHWRAVTKLV